MIDIFTGALRNSQARPQYSRIGALVDDHYRIGQRRASRD